MSDSTLSAGPVRPAGESHSPFRPITVIALVLAAVFALSAMAALNAFAPELEQGSNGGEHALSRSAVGYAAYVSLLQQSGRPVTLSRSPTPSYDDERLLILTPTLGRDENAIDHLRWAAQTSLIVLPKWHTSRAPLHKGWVQDEGLIPASDVLRVLPTDLQTGLVMAEASASAAAPHLTDYNGGLIATGGPIRSLRTLSGPGWIPLIQTPDGRAVVVYHEDTGVMVLADPDLINTMGMNDPAKARAALALTRELTVPGQAVTFDLTLNGFGKPRSILRMLLQPPLLGFTLCLLMAAALVGWQAMNRFAPHVQAARAVALGKHALADNTSALVRLARRERSMAVPYAELVRQQAGRAVAAPSSLSRDDLTALLDRLAQREGAEASFETLAAEAKQARNANDLMVVVRKLLKWKSELTRGRG